jgi:hypothetical protein
MEVVQWSESVSYRAYFKIRPDDGGSKHLWNVGQALQIYKTQYSKKLPYSYTKVLHARAKILWKLINWKMRTESNYLALLNLNTLQNTFSGNIFAVNSQKNI